MYLLDTNICVAIIRQKPPAVLQRLTQQPLGTVALSSITVAELAYGVAKSSRPSHNQAALEAFLLPFDVLDFDLQAALVLGQIRVALERQGLPIGGMDLLIGAHALSLNRTLVTHNTREFERIPNLVIDDWMS